ncbi:hypothetical protein IIA15_00970 [candidate division TA06 bacterium]|nr:hypothetical protein [candidate division TA06 bacterium]
MAEDEVDEVPGEDEGSEQEEDQSTVTYNMSNMSLPQVTIKTSLRIADHVYADIEASASAYQPETALIHARNAFSAALAGANLVKKEQKKNDY